MKKQSIEHFISKSFCFQIFLCICFRFFALCSFHLLVLFDLLQLDQDIVSCDSIDVFDSRNNSLFAEIFDHSLTIANCLKFLRVIFLRFSFLFYFVFTLFVSFIAFSILRDVLSQSFFDAFFEFFLFYELIISLNRW